MAKKNAGKATTSTKAKTPTTPAADAPAKAKKATPTAPAPATPQTTPQPSPTPAPTSKAKAPTTSADVVVDVAKVDEVANIKAMIEDNETALEAAYAQAENITRVLARLDIALEQAMERRRAA